MTTSSFFAPYGYQELEVISDTGRNRACKLQKDNQLYFGKVNLTKSPNALASDAWWLLTMTDIAAQDPKTPFVVPELITYDREGVLITSWVEGPLLAEKWDQAELLEADVQVLADIVVYLDQLRVPLSNEMRDRTTSTAPFNYIGKKLDVWAERPLAEGLLNQNQLNQAKKIIADHQPHAEPSLQHGDFVPWHIMRVQDNKYCLFDGEHAGLFKPRWYDLAYCYSRLYTINPARNSARLLIKLVQEQTQLTTQDLYYHLKPIMTQRAIGVLFDAYNDQAEVNYIPHAQQLLEACLSGKPEQLW